MTAARETATTDLIDRLPRDQRRELLKHITEGDG